MKIETSELIHLMWLGRIQDGSRVGRKLISSCVNHLGYHLYVLYVAHFCINKFFNQMTRAITQAGWA